MKKLIYAHYTYLVRSGDFETNVSGVVSGTSQEEIDKEIDRIISTAYGEGELSCNAYFFDGETIATRHQTTTGITKEEYDVLVRFL